MSFMCLMWKIGFVFVTTSPPRSSFSSRQSWAARHQPSWRTLLSVRSLEWSLGVKGPDLWNNNVREVDRDIRTLLSLMGVRYTVICTRRRYKTSHCSRPPYRPPRPLPGFLTTFLVPPLFTSCWRLSPVPLKSPIPSWYFLFLPTKLHVTCHVSRVTYHVSHVKKKFGQSVEAYKWRVFYQRVYFFSYQCNFWGGLVVSTL